MTSHLLLHLALLGQSSQLERSKVTHGSHLSNSRGHPVLSRCRVTSDNLSCIIKTLPPNFSVTAPSGLLDVTVVYMNPEQHCCQESSDEEAWPEDKGHQAAHPTPALRPLLCNRGDLGKDITTSGYSSVSSLSPISSLDGGMRGSPRSTSVLSVGSYSNTKPCHHQAKKSCLQCRPPNPPESGVHQQRVKRQNLSVHSDEDTNLGFLKL